MMDGKSNYGGRVETRSTIADDGEDRWPVLMAMAMAITNSNMADHEPRTRWPGTRWTMVSRRRADENQHALVQHDGTVAEND